MAAKKKKRVIKKKKVSYSQIVLAVILAFSIRWIEKIINMAEKGIENVPQELGVAIVTGLLLALVSYHRKRLGEKKSANENNIEVI